MTVTPPRPVTTDPTWAQLTTWHLAAYWSAFGVRPARRREWRS